MVIVIKGFLKFADLFKMQVNWFVVGLPGTKVEKKDLWLCLILFWQNRPIPKKQNIIIIILSDIEAHISYKNLLTINK